MAAQEKLALEKVHLKKSQLDVICEDHPYALVFATVSGAHLYGFASADSDVDLRGAHLLPAAEVVGLKERRDTIELMVPPEDPRGHGLDLDLVTHDIEKFMRLLLKPNGYVLEQLLSPLVVRTSPLHQALIDLSPKLLTKFHAHHYLGFAQNQWKLLNKEQPPRVKPLLYAYRVVLTGIHLMRTGELNANLLELNAHFKLGFIDALVALKSDGAEKERLPEADWQSAMAFHKTEFERLMLALENAREATHLPEAHHMRDEVSDLLVSARLAEK